LQSKLASNIFATRRYTSTV